MAWIGILAAAAGAWAAPPVFESTVADQTDVAVTAYNNGLALVRDVRKVKLASGEAYLRFADVAAQIRAETVSLKSLAAPGSAGILEQNYEYDLMSPSKLMEKYVGKPVRLVNFSTQIGFQQVEAELLSLNEGPVYRVNGEIYLGHPGYVVLPEIPENLIAKPSLVWLIENAREDQELEVQYLTRGISWRADYVLNLDRDDASLDLAGWVTMDNQSGATYANARLKLVAGEVSIVSPEIEATEEYAADDKLGVALDRMPAEEAFAEYHLYTMPRRTTIKQNQSKQLALLEAGGVRCAKRFEYRGQEHFYSGPMPPTREEHVEVFLEFENREDNHLGIPLPGGIMRIYQQDSEGMAQFAGEDRIEHTPKDEKVRLRMGKAFDVVGERVQKDYQRISNKTHECCYEITLRNHKENDIVVEVVEPMPSDWKVLESSQDFEKRDAHTAVFRVPVKTDGTAMVTYRVRVTY
jgi:hypothetical protein